MAGNKIDNPINKEEYHIRAYTSLVETPLHVLKHDKSFVILNHFGNIRPVGIEKHGLFFHGTRFLSKFMLGFNHESPLFLSSSVKEYNDFLTVDLTNPDFTVNNGKVIKTGNVHLVRIIFLYDGVLYEQLCIRNYGDTPVDFSLTYEFETDFADIFEVRGQQRTRRGTLESPLVTDTESILTYEGLDNLRRTATIRFTPSPHELRSNWAFFPVELMSKEEKRIELNVVCRIAELNGKTPIRRYHSPAHAARELSFTQAYQQNQELYQGLRENTCYIITSNDRFNEWLNRSRADLFMLLTDTPYGCYPYAGIPWFSTIFGRDGIITALETLWLYPQIAKGVLNYLAYYQAQEVIPFQDAEPGKILHEQRLGEMANLKEVPFGEYYGSIDATPLYIILAYDYYQRTADKEFICQIWPSIERALAWIDRYGDPDGDGFFEYIKKTSTGLYNQGWKDSDDAIFHHDGSLAGPPIALCEVQGYVYAAKTKAARLASLLGNEERAASLLEQAEQLKTEFYKKFWCEETGMYALALDKDKKPCAVKTSNPGHCLFTGLAAPDHAAQIVKNFMCPDFFTGWGIRTVSSEELRYNPMSYHNGSIWPHDNALIGYGMSLYGYKEEATRVLEGLFNASTYMPLSRLPELYCGFKQRPQEGPTLYPVACNPQAWASAAVFLLVQACLGLKVDAPAGKVYFTDTALPPSIQYLRIHNLQVGASSVDIQLTYHPQDVGINVMKRTGNVEIICKK